MSAVLHATPSARVDLLPRAVAERRRTQRITTWSIVAVGVFVLLLGGVYAVKLAAIRDAEAARAVVQADVDRLNVEVAALDEYRLLAAERDARNAVLATAMEREVSFARVLNDTALALPATASLRGMTVALQEPVDPTAEVALAPGDAVASLTYTGYSVERFAPGVEGVLDEFGKVGSGFGTFLSAAREEEVGADEVTAFESSLKLDDGAYTRRYAEGLPAQVDR
jgi:hypothetical protein